MNMRKCISGIILVLLIVGSISGLSYAYDLNNDGYVDIIFTRFQYGGEYATTAYIYWGDDISPYTTMGELAILGAIGVSAGTSSAFSQTYIPESDDDVDVVPEPLTIVLLILGLTIRKFVEIKKFLGEVKVYEQDEKA